MLVPRGWMVGDTWHPGQHRIVAQSSSRGSDVAPGRRLASHCSRPNAGSSMPVVNAKQCCGRSTEYLDIFRRRVSNVE